MKKNKRGDIPILILVVGIVILCGIALASFYLSGEKNKGKVDLIFNLQEIYTLAESIKFSGNIANYQNVREEGDNFIIEKKYFEDENILMEIKYTSKF